MASCVPGEDGGAQRRPVAGDPATVFAFMPPMPVAIIPARYASTRFPGKALALLDGRPMIWHVAARARRAQGLGRVIVATDDARIRDAVASSGAEVVMTRSDHVSGSDRVCEAVRRLDVDAEFEIIVNLQGDMPTLDPRLVAACIEPLATPLEDGGAHIGTIAAEIADARLGADPNVVKVIGSPIKGTRRMRALYFTRAAAPYGEG